MTRGEDFTKKGMCKNKHCSSMSNIAWCDINKNNILRLHDYFLNPNYKYQKQTTLTPKQFQLEGAGFRNTLKKLFKGSQTASNKFLKPAVKVAAPFIGMAVGDKTKNPKVAQATTNILKSISGGEISSLTNMHSSAGIRLRVM